MKYESRWFVNKILGFVNAVIELKNRENNEQKNLSANKFKFYRKYSRVNRRSNFNIAEAYLNMIINNQECCEDNNFFN